MRLHTLPALVKPKKRLGRGIGSRGAKSGRGQKGQRSRAGARLRSGFEGGQTPLYMRLPKGRGVQQTFNPQGRRTQAITLNQLNGYAAKSIVGPGQLRARGLVRDRYQRVKLVARGKLTQKLTVRVHAATPAAQEAVAAAGGTIEIIS